MFAHYVSISSVFINFNTFAADFIENSIENA